MMTDDVWDRAVPPTPNLSATLAEPSETLAYRVLYGQAVIVNLKRGTLHVLNRFVTAALEFFIPPTAAPLQRELSLTLVT